MNTAETLKSDQFGQCWNCFWKAENI